MSTHSPAIHTSTTTGSPLDASPDALKGPATAPIRRCQPITRAARPPGISHSSQQTHVTMFEADVANVARTRRNLETATIGRSSGIHW
jgi:hypothetical protein